MKDIKFYILLGTACLLLVLCAVLPLVLEFGGSMEMVTVLAPAPESETVPLVSMEGAEEEMRGLWIATVNNINFPSKQKLSAKKLAAELDAIVDFAKENKFKQ